MKNTHYRNIIIEAIRPFSLTPKELLDYLEMLNNLPLYDIELNLLEASMIFKQERNSGEFNEAEASAIEEFIQLCEGLPAEDSEFWADDSLSSESWCVIRSKALCTMRILGC